MTRLVGRTLVAWLAAGVIAGVLLAACGRPTGSAPSSPATPVTALVGGTVQAAPEASAIPDGVVLIAGGVVTAVGARAQVPVPAGATVIDCAGGTVTAGFWNSHVHFTDVPFQGAETAPAPQLAGALSAMLTSYGVVHAIDIGSFLPNTLALRRRVESGEIPGPAILTAGTGFAPEGGSPYYILPARLPELRAAGDAPAMVNDSLDRGADLVKLFTGSWARRDLIVVMPVAIVRAATDAAHRRGALVFAHPSNSAGARAAIEGGVDVLAHTFPSELDRQPWDRALPGLMRERGMALVPTLKLFVYELRKLDLPPAAVDAVLGDAKAQLHAFAELGGPILFGTDVGYMTDFDPADEYALMAQAGLGYPQILAALTTAPAARFGAAARAGRLAPGFDGDVVVLDGDPSRDVRALARVRATVRAGRVIYRTPS